MKNQTDTALPPAALYARVPATAGTWTFPSLPSFERLGTSPRVTVTLWAGEYVDEAESGRIADRPPSVCGRQEGRIPSIIGTTRWLQ